MKKVISLILCVAMLAASLTVFASAQQSEKNDTPVIFVPGFLQPYMFIENEEEGQEDFYVWLPHIETIINRIIEDLPNFLRALFGLVGGDVRGFGEVLGGGAYAVAEKMRCNPDGSSIYPITHYNNDPAEANGANLKKIVDKEGERKNFLFEDFADYLAANNYKDYEDIFIFEYDSRHDAIEIADELREYIKAVKEYTGAPKVNVFTVSYGGLITSCYLYSYMQECDVEKVVMNVPPLQGTDFPDRLFRATVDLPLYTIVDFAESVLGIGTDIASLVANADNSFFNTLLNAASSGMIDVVQYWGSVYSITSTDYYEGLKRDFLDPVESTKIIENTDKIHYEIMPAMAQTFEKCREYGIGVSILTCTGANIIFGGTLDGDILVPTYSASGAKTADYGKCFENGYEPIGTACSDPSHNHVSPDMQIDATCAYLPENTWFLDKSYHAMFELEDYSLALFAKLLCTDELKDVHSDPNFPQFEYSYNPHRGIHAGFDSSLPGYISSTDTALVVKNLYKSSPIVITKITAEGSGLSFNIPAGKIIKPGQSLEISCSGTVPDVSATRCVVQVSYLKIGSGIKTMSIPMTINNSAE